MFFGVFLFVHLTIMKYQAILAKTLRRYKRFFADVELPSKEVAVTHCVNTGPMTGCWAEGIECVISKAENPDRKLKYTLEMTKVDGTWIGVNTHRPNKIVAEALKEGKLLYPEFKTEFSLEDSRFDFYFPQEKLVLEVKSVTLKKDNTAMFPDTVSTRAQKHVIDLMRLKAKGYRVAVLFLIQREDCLDFSPSEEHDPEYARILKKAHEDGLEVLAYSCKVSPGEIVLDHIIPVSL